MVSQRDFHINKGEKPETGIPALDARFKQVEPQVHTSQLAQTIEGTFTQQPNEIAAETVTYRPDSNFSWKRLPGPVKAEAALFVERDQIGQETLNLAIRAVDSESRPFINLITPVRENFTAHEESFSPPFEFAAVLSVKNGEVTAEIHFKQGAINSYEKIPIWFGRGLISDIPVIDELDAQVWVRAALPPWRL